MRGKGINFVFQDALSSFCPVHSVTDQLWDAARVAGLTKEDFAKRAASMAEIVGLPANSLKSYPQELSGGMVQRAELLFPLIVPPELVLADEPTSAVDSITQKKMADAFLHLRKTANSAIILVTHNLRLAAYLADTILVLKDGHIQEYGAAKEVIAKPASDYTRELLVESGLYEEA